MFKFAKSLRPAVILLSLIAGVAITGCRGPAAPDPSMTAVRGQGAGGSDSADWISPEVFWTAESTWSQVWAPRPVVTNPIAARRPRVRKKCRR